MTHLIELTVEGLLKELTELTSRTDWYRGFSKRMFRQARNARQEAGRLKGENKRLKAKLKAVKLETKRADENKEMADYHQHRAVKLQAENEQLQKAYETSQERVDHISNEVDAALTEKAILQFRADRLERVIVSLQNGLTQLGNEATADVMAIDDTILND